MIPENEHRPIPEEFFSISPPDAENLIEEHERRARQEARELVRKFRARTRDLDASQC